MINGSFGVGIVCYPSIDLLEADLSFAFYKFALSTNRKAMQSIIRFLLMLMMGVWSTWQGWSAPHPEFSYDKAKVEAALVPLTKWEAAAEDPDLAINPSPTAGIDFRGSGGGIPPFLWGFVPSMCGACGGGFIGGCIISAIGGVVGGLAGIAGAYFLNDQDQEMAKKAALGCVVGTGVGVEIAILYRIIIFGAFYYW